MVIGMVWYKNEDTFNEYKRISSTGAHEVHISFDEWLKAAEKELKEHEARGDTVVKVYIDPAELVLWAENRGLNIDADTCNRFADAVVRGKTYEE
jgi:hypothetical protein